MNKRRSSTKNSKVKLPRYKVTKGDLKSLEKIIFKYISPADFYIDIGKTLGWFEPSYAKYQFDSARKVPGHILRKRPIIISSKAPNVTVTFNRYSTIVYSGRVYREGSERAALDRVVREISIFLDSNREPEASSTVD